MLHRHSFAITLLFTPLAQLLGQPGTLDPAFNGTGIVRTALPNTSLSGSSCWSYTNGNILVAARRAEPFSTYGDLMVLRYLNNGSLDPSFGTNGMISYGYEDIALFPKLEATTDGRFLVATSVSTGIAIVRLLGNGMLDPSFGTNGRVDLIPGPDRSAINANAISQTTDGRIVIGGSTTDFDGNRDMLVARVLLDGTPDPSFGNEGITTIQVSEANDQVNDLTILPDGRILLVGFASFGEFKGLQLRQTVVRLLGNGTLDTSFGMEGVHTLVAGGDFGSSLGIAQDADGSILVSGSAASGPPELINNVLLRFTSEGQPDPSFGSSGVVVTEIEGLLTGRQFMTIQPDGKIVTGFSTCCIEGNGIDVSVIRQMPNGDLDQTFGVNGTMSATIGGFNDWVLDLHLNAEFKIIVSGATGTTSNNEILLMRMNNDIDIGIRETRPSTPIEINLYPQPANDRVNYGFQLMEPGHATMRLLDLQGRVIRTIFENRWHQAGEHHRQIDVDTLDPGCYILLLTTADGVVSSTRMVISR